MKKILLMLVLLPLMALADTEVVNGIEWTYTIREGRAEIGDGSSAAISNTTTGAIRIPATLDGCPVTSIANYAFSGCESIISVRFPDSVTRIGWSAFWGCKSLTSVYATSVESWLQIYFESQYSNPCANRASLYFDRGSTRTLLIPEGCTSIGDYKFAGCDNISFIYIPESVTHIASSALSDCLSLASIEVASGNSCYRSIDGALYHTYSYASDNCNELVICPPAKVGRLTLPATATYVWQGKFESCLELTALEVEAGHPEYYSYNGCLYSRNDNALVIVPGGMEKLVLPENLSQINVSLSNCKRLRSVQLSAGITKIPERAFAYCRNLESVSIPQGVLHIGSYAFEDCERLTSIVIPNSVQKIGSYAFQGCDNLREMTIPFAGTTPTSQFYDLFGYSSVPASLQTVRITNATALPDSAFRGCENIRSISLPVGLSSIGNQAFSGCKSLCEITVPAGVSRIGSRAFENCESLRRIVIPAGVTEIDNSAFEGCKALEEVSLPAGVVKIGASAFEGCGALHQVVVPAGVTEIADSTFKGCTTLEKVTLPAGLSKIGFHAFENCRRLSSINIPSTVTAIEGNAFYACQSLGSGVVIVDNCLLRVGPGCPADVRIPDSVRLIALWAFEDCPNLRTVVFPKGLQEIPGSLLEECVNLRTVSIPSSVKHIGPHAFAGCRNLESISLPEGIQSLGCHVFYGCTSIRSFHIPASLVEIDDDDASALPGSFSREDWDEEEDGSYHPSQLTQLTVAAGNPRYAAFNNLLYTKDGKILIRCPEGLESVKFKTGTQRICYHAFDNCARLREVVIPASVKEIGSLSWDDEENEWSWWTGDRWSDFEIFEGCAALRKVALPAGLTTIRLSRGLPSLVELTVDSANKTYLSYSNALYRRDGARLVYCARGVSSVTLWNQTETIGSCAFEDCDKIKALVVPATVKRMESSPFYGCTNLRTIEYKGNAPSVDGDLYLLKASWGGGGICSPEPLIIRRYLDVTSYAMPGTKGWPTSGVWQERPLVFGRSPSAPAVPGPVDSTLPPPLVDKTETIIDVEWGEVAPYAVAATVYDGYLADSSGIVMGTIQVKVAKGKVDKKSGAFSAKVTASVVMANGTKIAFKNGLADETGRVTGLVAAGHTIELSLGVDGLGGTLDGRYAIDGCRNFYSSKDKGEKAAADSLTRRLIGPVNVLLPDGRGTLTASIAAKGKVKVSGTVDGVKVSGSSQLLIGDVKCFIPVIVSKKVNLAFGLVLDGTAGQVTVVGQGMELAKVGRVGVLQAGARFSLGVDQLAAKLPGLYVEYLPKGIPVSVSGTKWIVAGGAKAGKVVLDRKTSEIDQSKIGVNPSGLKLTYKAKDGSFKGSFKAYALESGKVKVYTVNVEGVMIGDVAYGTALLKKPLVSCEISISTDGD